MVIVDGPDDLGERARQTLDRLERRWSRFLPTSEVSALSGNEGGPTVVSADTFDLVSQAVDAWRQTDGRFDPTLGRTMAEAGYDRSFDQLDRGEVIGTDRHRPAPTPEDIILDPHYRAVTLPPGVELDLGGIAKGAAADLVGAELLADGAAGCCVNVGGDLRVMGESPNPDGWRVSLGGETGGPRVAVRLGTGAICTSTTSKRRWTSPAGPEHHLRDPATGRPADSGLQTVSIICATAIQGEVLAKVALLAGPSTGGDIVTRAGATGLFVDDRGRRIGLPDLDRFTIEEPLVSAR